MRSEFLFVGLLCVGGISIWIGVSVLLGYRRIDHILPHYYSGGIYASIPGKGFSVKGKMHKKAPIG